MIEDVTASVHQRLLNRAREEGRPFNELLQYFALERFLYRLSHSPYRDVFVLKGALMLTVWRVPLPRPTRDIDLLGRTDSAVANVVSIIQEICEQSAPDDGLDFAADAVVGERIIEAAEYGGVRVRFDAYLGNARVPMQIDVGFGDSVVPDPTLIRLPAMLEFPSPELHGYSRESAIAEKVHTMVRLGEINSRMKDFFDVWLLATRGSFDGEVLADAVQATFRQRATSIPGSPVALSDEFGRNPDRQVQWAAFLRRYRLSDLADVPPTLSEAVQVIAAFLHPVLQAATNDRRFDKQWSAGGPWRPSA
jgi:predicted nucleotidyltransferase component of viral defense system